MPAADVDKYMADTNPGVRAILAALHDLFDSHGCSSYVKTIYIGYEINGDMVAAAYAHADHIEVALAVAEDHPNERLKDASHLTWRTLPLALELRTPDDVPHAASLINEACARVRGQHHGVHRDNDYFINRKKGRTR